jgi:hypothetical protein
MSTLVYDTRICIKESIQINLHPTERLTDHIDMMHGRFCVARRDRFDVA